MPEVEASEAALGLEDIKALLAAFDASGAATFKLKRGDFKLELSKGLPPVSAAVAPVANLVAAPAVVPAPASPAAPAAPAPAPAGPVIRSPMVGTFYRSPSPDAAPFLSVGDVVKPGQTVCIVEAMKLMNEIEAEHAGRVVRILVENAQPVEYGQALIELEPV